MFKISITLLIIFALQTAMAEKKYSLTDLEALQKSNSWKELLEHIEDDEQVLRNFREVLDKGGKLIISSPSNFDESAKFTEEHVRPGYSKEEIYSKLERAGFSIRSFEYSYGKFGQIYWKLALKYPLSLISKSKILAILLPIYYIIFYPIAFGFMLLDYYNKNKIGTGVIVVAEQFGSSII